MKLIDFKVPIPIGMFAVFERAERKEAERFGWNLVPDESLGISAKNVKTVIDAGAASGERLAYLLSVFPVAIIHCFETSEVAFDALDRKYRNHSRVILNRMALCGSNGIGLPGTETIPFQQSIDWYKVPGTDHRLVRVTLDNYCQVCRLETIDLIVLPGMTTEAALFNGCREQLEDGTIRALLVPFQPSAPKQIGAVNDIAFLHRGLASHGFTLEGIKGSADDSGDFLGHMLYVQNGSSDRNYKDPY